MFFTLENKRHEISYLLTSVWRIFLCIQIKFRTVNIQMHKKIYFYIFRKVAKSFIGSLHSNEYCLGTNRVGAHDLKVFYPLTAELVKVVEFL